MNVQHERRSERMIDQSSVRLALYLSQMLSKRVRACSQSSDNARLSSFIATPELFALDLCVCILYLKTLLRFSTEVLL